MSEKKVFVNKLISCIGIPLSFFIVLIIVYSAVIQAGYFFLDDYYYFTPPGDRSLEQFMQEAIREGRVTEGFLLYAISSSIESSESTKVIRLIGIIGIALFASVIYAIFRKSRFRGDHAFLMSALICMLPPFHLFASWMIIVPSIYAALLASLSALLIFNCISSEKESEQANNTIVFFTASALLIVALSINQPPAMMYWSMGVIYFLAREKISFMEKKCRTQIVQYFSVGFCATIIYYLVYIKTIPIIMNIPGRGKLIDIQYIPAKMKWFILVPFKYASNLWNIHPTYTFAIFIGAIILIGIIIGFLQEIKHKKIVVSNYCQKYFLVSCLVILSYHPNLMVTENEAGYRVLISLTTALSILLFFGLANIVKFLKGSTGFSSESGRTILSILLITITVFAAFSAYNNVKKFVTLYATELSHMRDTLKGNRDLYSEVYIRRPRLPATHGREGEFRLYPNTIAEGGPIMRIVRQAVLEAGVTEDMQITQGAADDPVPEDNDTLIIDLVKKLDSLNP